MVEGWRRVGRVDRRIDRCVDGRVERQKELITDQVLHDRVVGHKGTVGEAVINESR